MHAASLIALGALFLGGLIADTVSRKTGLPRVTLLLIFGLAVGEAGFALIPADLQAWYDLLTVIALTMVAFLLGGGLHRDTLRQHGRAIMAISVAIVLGTLAIVSVGLTAMGLPFGLALLMAAIATATAPAATSDVITQSGVNNGFTQTLRGIVAIDDVWGLVGFSLVLVIVAQLQGHQDLVGLSHAAWEIGGAITLGLVIGGPAAMLTGRLRDGEPLQIEALSLVFLSAGLSLWLEVSFLITGIVVGAVIVNLATHHTKAFHEIEHIQWPFVVLFFILAGGALDIAVATTLGVIGLAFVILRTVARIISGWVGAQIAGVPAREGRWYGAALLPQAGVAIGMSLIAAQRFPDWGPQIIALTIGTTVVFELLGPVATLIAIRRTQKQA
ncbi:cation:proton antiporter [Yoonia sp. F2084L]|uniref:cation:proton antiporter n=1 Tax=Yoonia sp. F2084L TaxID=2926419 RepID=UPI001FF55367|nr:cation:proton antiporter [Yoonia sp. F2084L]